MVPIKIPTSTNVGSKRHHVDGKCPLLKTIAIISKRSNHIPILMAIEIKNVIMKLLLNFLIHNNCGVMILKVINDQNAHA